MPTAPLPLPEGAVLVHVGPYKTGSSAIQSTLSLQRTELRERGVLYPGSDHRHFRAEWALTGRQPRGNQRVPAERWDELVEEVRSAPSDRVVVSSEGLSSLRPHEAERLVRDLGPDRVHVLVVARRLDALLPSAWQQRVKGSHERRPYDEWLHEVLDGDAEQGPRHAFWNNHGMPTLLGRWTAVLPSERLVVLVADEDDRAWQRRAFEQLLGLPDQLLRPGPRDNSSLTYDRVELFRRAGAAFDERGWDHTRRRKLLTHGLLDGLLEVARQPTESRLPELPRWAAERVAELSDERVDEVRSSGALVLGDPELLRLPKRDWPGEVAERPDTVPVEAAARGVVELVAASVRLEEETRKAAVRQARRTVRRRAQARAQRRARRWARQRRQLERRVAVDDLSSRELLRVVARRQWARLHRRR